MSLSRLVYADIAQRRFSGMFATPDSFRLNQSPLGAVLPPQAPTSVGHTPSPGGLSLAQAGSPFLGSRRFPVNHCFHPCGTPSYDMGLDDSLTIANVLVTRTACSVCTQPLMLPVHQNPLVAFLQHQAPTAKHQLARPFPDITSVPGYRI